MKYEQEQSIAFCQRFSQSYGLLTFIARRVSWTSDGKFLFAAVGDGDSDIVLFAGLIPQA